MEQNHPLMEIDLLVHVYLTSITLYKQNPD